MAQKLLYVEPSISLKVSFEYFFQAIGFDVTCASSVDEANELVEGVQFDLAVVNFDCPVVNGNKLVWDLAQQGKYFPVIATTRQEHTIMPSALITEVVYKPGSVFEILEAIDKSLTVMAN